MAVMAFALLAVHVPIVLADAALLAVSERGAERVAVRQLSTAFREVVRTLVVDAEAEPTGTSPRIAIGRSAGSPGSLGDLAICQMRERLLGALLLDLPPPAR